MANQSRTLELLLKVKNDATKELINVQGQLKALNPELKSVGVASGVAFATLSSAVGLSIKSFVTFGDKLNNLAVRTGFSAQALSEWNFIAEQSGTSLESLDAGIRGMSNAIVDAASGTGKSAAAFNTLGISLSELQKLTTEEAFIKLGTAVASVEDPTLRSSLAMDLFGRQGRELVPIFQNGRVEIEKMRDEAKRLGNVYDVEMTKKAKELDSSLKILSSSFERAKSSIAVAFAPALTKLAESLAIVISRTADFIKENPRIVSAALTAAIAITGITTAGIGLAFMLPKLVVAWKLFEIAMIKTPYGAIIAAIGLIASAFVFLIGRTKDASGEFDKLKNAVDDLQDGFNSSVETIDTARLSLKMYKQEAEDTAKKIKDVEKSVTDLMRVEGQKQQDYKENLAQAFIDQEKRVADLRLQIQEKEADIALGNASVKSIEELNILRSKLAKEEEALNNNAFLKQDIAAQLVEMQRRSQLTEFELRVENLMRQRVADLQAFKEKLEGYVAEQKALKAHLAEVEKMYNESSNKIIEIDNRTANAIFENTSRIKLSISERSAAIVGSAVAQNAVFLNSAPQTSGATTVPVFFSQSKNVKDAIITPDNKVITTAPDDYIIAMKRPQDIVGGGITVNVYGDVTGAELISKIKESLMRELRFDTRFAV